VSKRGLRLLVVLGMGIALAVFCSPGIIRAQVNPEEIIEKSIAAQGGREVLEGVKDMVTTLSIKIFTPQGEYLGERTAYTKSEPMKVRIEQTMMGVQTIIGYDGQTAWLEQMGRVMVAPQTIMDSIKASEIREDLLLKYKEKGCSVEYLGEEKVGERTCHMIKLTDKEGNETIFCFDAETYYVIKMGFQAPDERTGEMVKNEVVNSDFRPVEKMIVPFKIESFVGGEKLMESVIKEVKINQGLDDALFTMPEQK